MKRIQQQKRLVLWRMLAVVLAIWIMGNFRQSIAESVVDTSTLQKIEKTLHEDKESIPLREHVQLAKLTYVPDKKPDKESVHKSESKKIYFFQKLENVHVILIGGVLLIIGTFFVPNLFPQLTSYHGKLFHFLENTLKTYKTIIQGTQRRSMPCPVITNTFTETLGKTKRNTFIPKDRDMGVAYYTLRCESILSPPLKSPLPRYLTTEMTRKFFQHSGFTLKKMSSAELRVNSPLPSYTHYGEIPVFIANDKVLDKEGVRQIYARVHSQYQDVEPRAPYMKVAFVVVTTPPEDSAYQQIYNYRVKHNFTIIPLSHLLVAKSVKCSSCAQELDEKLSLSTGQYNLYAMDTPMADPLSFFGRTNIINQLLDAISHQQHIGLFGLQKIGKTRLAWQLKEHLSDHIAVYVDLQYLPKDSSSLYRKILDECIRDVAFKYPEIQLPELSFTQADHSEASNIAFMHDIVSLWEQVRAKRKDVKVILLLDGVEHLFPAAFDADGNFWNSDKFLGAIHKISQQYGFLVSVMISTSLDSPRTHEERVQSNRGFQHYEEVFLSFLSEDECNHMIKTIGTQMGLQYTEESLSRLYYETGGHPYVTRQICSLIAKTLIYSNSERHSLDSTKPTIVQVRDVERAVGEYIEYKSDYLESIWQKLSNIEREIMFTITTKDSCTLEDLITADCDDRTTCKHREAISLLIANDLIEMCEEKYSVTMGLFEQLILTNN